MTGRRDEGDASAERHVALISVAGAHRTQVAAYLTGAGFDVHEYDQLDIPRSFHALVVLADEAAGGDIVACVRSWMKPTKHQRIVIVTSQPAALRNLVAVHGDRLFVLAAPAFGWELVDALRWRPVPTGRGA
jgi:hypothetical protein